MMIKDLLKKTRIYKVYINKRHNNYINKRIEQIRKEGKEIVKILETTLESTGLTYFATCGTLLGYIREKAILKNDYDFDYAIMIYSGEEWKILEKELNHHGFEKIRYFMLDGNITEQTYRSNNGIEVDFFGHYIIDGILCFYSYDKIPSENYKEECEWSVYILKNGSFAGVEKMNIDIGTVTVPRNAGEYLSFNYNDDWMIPNPSFKANTGKGCQLLKNKRGIIHNL